MCITVLSMHISVMHTYSTAVTTKITLDPAKQVTFILKMQQAHFSREVYLYANSFIRSNLNVNKLQIEPTVTRTNCVFQETGPTTVGDEYSDPAVMSYLGARKTTVLGNNL